MMVLVGDPQGLSNILNVRLYVGLSPTGLYLYDDGQHCDFGPGDGVYGFCFDFQPGDLEGAAGQLLLEAVANDIDGNKSDIWPYLQIK